MNKLYKILPIVIIIALLGYIGFKFFSKMENPLGFLGSGFGFGGGGRTEIVTSSIETQTTANKTIYRDGTNTQSYDEITNTETIKKTSLGDIRYNFGDAYNIDEINNKIFTKKDGDTLIGSALEEDDEVQKKDFDLGENDKMGGSFGKKGNTSNCSGYILEINKKAMYIKTLTDSDKAKYIYNILIYIPKFGGGTRQQQDELIALMIKDLNSEKPINAKVYCDMIEQFEESLAYKQCVMALTYIVENKIKGRKEILDILEKQVSGFSGLPKEQKDIVLDEIEKEFGKETFSVHRICSLISELIYDNYYNAQCFRAMEKILNLGDKMNVTNILTILNSYMTSFKILTQKEQEQIAQGILANYNKNKTLNIKDECYKIDSLINEKLDNNISYAQCLKVMENIALTYKDSDKDSIPEADMIKKLNEIAGFNILTKEIQLKIVQMILDAIGSKEIQNVNTRKELCKYITEQILLALDGSSEFKQCVAIIEGLVKAGKNKTQEVILAELDKINGFSLVAKEIREDVAKKIMALNIQDPNLQNQITNICTIIVSAIIDAFKQTESYKKCIKVIDEQIIAPKLTTQEQIKNVIEKEFRPTKARDELIKNVWISVSKNDDYVDLNSKKEQYCINFSIQEFEELSDDANYKKCVSAIRDNVFNKPDNKNLPYIEALLKKIFPLVDSAFINKKAVEILNMPNYDALAVSNICFALTQENNDNNNIMMCVRNLYSIYASDKVITQKMSDFTQYIQSYFGSKLNNEKFIEKRNLFEALLSSNNTSPEDTLVTICLPEESKTEEGTDSFDDNQETNNNNTDDEFEKIVNEEMVFPNQEQEDLCRKIVTSVENKRKEQKVKNTRFCRSDNNSENISTCLSRGDNMDVSTYNKNLSKSFGRDYFIPPKYYSSNDGYIRNADAITQIIESDSKLKGEYLMPARYAKNVEGNLSQTFSYALNSKTPPYNKYSNNTDLTLEMFTSVTDSKIIDILQSRFTNTKDTVEISTSTLYKNIFSASKEFCKADSSDGSRGDKFIASLNGAFLANSMEKKQPQAINGSAILYTTIDQEQTKIINNLKNKFTTDSFACGSDINMQQIILKELLEYSVILEEPSLNINNYLTSHTLAAFISRLFIDRDFILNPAIDDELKKAYIKQLGNCTRLDKDINHWKKVSKKMQDTIMGKKTPAYSNESNIINFKEAVSESPMYKEVESAFKNPATGSQSLCNCRADDKKCQNACTLNNFEYYKRLPKHEQTTLNRKLFEIDSLCLNKCQGNPDASCAVDCNAEATKEFYHFATVYFSQAVANTTVDDVHNNLGKISECEISGPVQQAQNDKTDFISLSDINKDFVVHNALSLMKNFERSAEKIRLDIITQIWNEAGFGPVSNERCVEIIDSYWGDYSEDSYNDSMKDGFEDVMLTLQNAFNKLDVGSKVENVTQPPSTKCKCVVNKMLNMLTNGKQLTISKVQECLTISSTDIGMLNLLAVQVQKYNAVYNSNPDNAGKVSSCVVLFSSIQSIVEDLDEVNKFITNREQNQTTIKQICVQQLRDVYGTLKVFRDQYFNQKDIDLLSSHNKDVNCDLLSDN